MVKARPSKRRPKPRALVRGEPVVRGVMEATMEELAHTGYGALRIEDVAARAGVNKTTVYRRWPTKEELVRAALQSLTAGRFVAPNNGSLRADMLEIARAMVAMCSSCEGEGLFRMILAAGPDSELMAIAKSMKKANEALPRSVIERAEARGELVPGVDALLLFHVLVSAVHHRIWMEREAVNEAFLVSLVDLLLYGATAPAQRPANSLPAVVAPPVKARAKVKARPRAAPRG
jgi:AcrR family transcriptional regulator